VPDIRPLWKDSRTPGIGYAGEVVEAHSVAIAATGAWGAVRLIAKLRFVPSICRIEGGGWFSIALVGNELADKVL
jgi:hypothetical protein